MRTKTKIDARGRRVAAFAYWAYRHTFLEPERNQSDREMTRIIWKLEEARQALRAGDLACGRHVPRPLRRR